MPKLHHLQVLLLAMGLMAASTLSAQDSPAQAQVPEAQAPEVRGPVIRSADADALVDHARAGRMSRAAHTVDTLLNWADGQALPEDVLERIDQLGDLLDPQDLGERLLLAALVHDLAGEAALEAFPGRSELLAAAAALSQDALTRVHEDPHGLDLSLDSLRALGDPSRLPPPGGLSARVAPVPPPVDVLPARVILERAETQVLEPVGGWVDWYAWIPGRDQLYARVGDRLMQLDPSGKSGVDLELRSPQDAPPPSMSGSGEYLAAIDGSGRVRVLQLGQEASGWRTVGPRSRVTALAFAPVGLAIAWADTHGVIHTTDISDGVTRELARGVGTVCALQWSPRGSSLAWDELNDDGTIRYWAGVVGVDDDVLVPPPLSAGNLMLHGRPQWAPDGESALGVGSLRGQQGLWLWGDDFLSLLHEFAPADITGQAVSPDFTKVALFLAPEEHPRPWGSAREVPFTFRPRRLWSLSVDWPTERKGRRLIYDRVLHRDADLSWSPDSEWLVGNLEERVELLRGPDAPLARSGLWAIHLPTGGVIPVTHEPGRYIHPRLNWEETWLVYLQVMEPAAGGRAARGRLTARRLATATPSRRESERAFLRSRPMLREGRTVEAAMTLRDAVRLDPDNTDVRLALAELYMELARTTETSAEAGMLLGAAVEELVRLHARSPGTLAIRQNLALSFLGYAAAAGRIYSAEAARRAKTFLRSDPQQETDPHRVVTILQPALVDAVLWDPANRDAWSLLEDGLRTYGGVPKSVDP